MRVTTSREEVDGFVDEEEPASLHQRNGASGGKLDDADANNSLAERKKRTERRHKFSITIERRCNEKTRTFMESKNRTTRDGKSWRSGPVEERLRQIPSKPGSGDDKRRPPDLP